jgi:hypothetical protein
VTSLGGGAHAQLQPDASAGELQLGAGEVAQRGGQVLNRDGVGYWPLGEPFPVLLTTSQLRRVLGIWTSYFYRLKAQGRYDALRVLPAPVNGTRYSGELVRRYVSGDLSAVHTVKRREKRS